MKYIYMYERIIATNKSQNCWKKKYAYNVHMGYIKYAYKME